MDRSDRILMCEAAFRLAHEDLRVGMSSVAAIGSEVQGIFDQTHVEALAIITDGRARARVVLDAARVEADRILKVADAEAHALRVRATTRCSRRLQEVVQVVIDTSSDEARAIVDFERSIGALV